MNVTKRWGRRLLSSMRVDPVDGRVESTLETFFAEVRWSEDRKPDGRVTLRLPSM